MAFNKAQSAFGANILRIHGNQIVIYQIVLFDLKKSVSSILWNGDLTVMASQSFKHSIDWALFGSSCRIKKVVDSVV